MCRNIENIYLVCLASVNINGYITDWFSTKYGVRQGDSLSPTLFSLFINDLATDLKSTNGGIEINGIKIHCLFYADDIAIIAQSEKELQ